MQAALERENKLPRETLEIENSEETFYNDEIYEENSCLDYEDNDFDYNEIMNNKYLIERITSQISERERDIVYRYYGINQNERYTLEDIGKVYGLTRERVRQIVDKAMTKMRSEALLIDSSYL
jgi:RNA polymerase sigma factor (sigma-70 family)